MVRIELRIEHLHKAADRGAVVAAVVVELSYFVDDVCHLVDRVVSSLRSRSVAGHALYVDSDLHAPSVSAVYAAVRRLCRDHEIDLASCVFRTVEVLVHDVLPAHSVAVLLHYGADYHDLVSLRDESEFLHDLCAVYGAGHSALLVGAAASVDDVVGLIALVRVLLPVVDVADPDCVDVGIDSDDLVSVAHPADDVAESVDLDLVIAELFHLGLDAHHDVLLFCAFARMRDHVSEEPAHFRSVFLSGFSYSFIIRNHIVYLRHKIIFYCI